MSRRTRGKNLVPANNSAAVEGELLQAQAGPVEAFTFGDPTPVLDGREILDYLECWFNGRWYETPMSMDGLAKTTRASVYLQSGLTFKRNMLARTFIPHKLLSRQAFEQFSLDWLWSGNCYLEKRKRSMNPTFKALT